MSGYAHVRNGSNAAKMGCPGHVRFTPVSDRTADIDGGPVRATIGSEEAGVPSHLVNHWRLACGPRPAPNAATAAPARRSNAPIQNVACKPVIDCSG
jgi:hypothetical protein